MKRGLPSRVSLCSATLVVAFLSGGCAAMTQSNEAIIRVQAKQNPAKAVRLTLQGVKATRAGQIDRAVDRFMAAIEADESYGPAHNNLGLLHYEQGNLYQAALAFEQAMDLMSYDPIVFYNLGLTLEAAGKTHEAMDLYIRAVEMDSANPHFLGNLVRLRIRLGEQGPDLMTQLQDLVLIETRPKWRRWADRQLALEFNESLDRGPETPDFNTRNDDDKNESDADSSRNVIDLTPATDSDQPTSKRRGVGGSSKSSMQGGRTLRDMILSEPNIVPSERIESPAPPPRSHPIPIQSENSLKLPPSIMIPIER